MCALRVCFCLCLFRSKLLFFFCCFFLRFTSLSIHRLVVICCIFPSVSCVSIIFILDILYGLWAVSHTRVYFGELVSVYAVHIVVLWAVQVATETSEAATRIVVCSRRIVYFVRVLLLLLTAARCCWVFYFYFFAAFIHAVLYCPHIGCMFSPVRFSEAIRRTNFSCCFRWSKTVCLRSNETKKKNQIVSTQSNIVWIREKFLSFYFLCVVNSCVRIRINKEKIPKYFLLL